MSQPDQDAFKPYVAANQSPKELTFKAILLGVIMAAVLGAANAYLGLKAGMTVAATFPAAVISMAILRAFKGTILEENIARTTGAVGEALAAGAIFTIPAFIMTGVWTKFDYLTATLLLLVGGVLGVLLVILLRRTFMEDRSLPFPESQACTEIVKAGQKGSSGAGTVFTAMGIAALIEFFKNANGISIVKENIKGVFQIGDKGTFPYVTPTSSPAFLGVGFIIGPRLAAITAAGGVFGWLLLMPVALFVRALFDPAAFTAIKTLIAKGDIAALYNGISAPQWRAAYGGAGVAFDGLKAFYSSNIKMIAIGAMIVGAFFTLYKMRSNLITGIGRSLKGIGAGGPAEIRTEKDLSFKWVFAAIGVMLLAMLGLYMWLCNNFGISLITMLVMAVAGFLFAAVAGYLVSIIGSSSNPISGLTLSTLLIAAGLLSLLGMGGTSGSSEWSAGVLAVLGVATVICCVAGVAGDMIQDWKVGHNLGGTPWRMEVGGLIGVVAAALVLVLPIMLLHEYGGGIGSDALPAPQAGLMATMANGIISGQMPWELIVIGMFFALALILIQSPSPMLIAVGMYLPFETTLAIFTGGVIKWIVDSATRKRAGESKKKKDQVENRGLLVASGLVAGEALVGIIIAGIVALGIKLTPDENYVQRVEAARAVVQQVEKVSADPAAQARAVLADQGLARRLLAAEQLVPEEIDAVLPTLDEKKVMGKLAAERTLAEMKLVGRAPGWFGQAWLGFLVIIGLGLYMVLTSLKALKEEEGTPPAPDDGQPGE
ncbi:MAG: oligopeptide transporter, OPT family [Deltaproteobacteria bacterium]|nr:MAG: oligopeptide transporter, OPT family [Deltaproteobacteria bacterium]